MATAQHQSVDTEEFIRALIGGTDTDAVAASVAKVATTPYGALAGGVSTTADRFVAIAAAGQIDQDQDGDVDIEWDTPTVDDDSYTWAALTPTVVTFASDGVYHVTAEVAVNGSGGTGDMTSMQLSLDLSDLTVPQPGLDVYCAPTVTDPGGDLALSTVIIGTAGDTLKVNIFTEGVDNWNISVNQTSLRIIKLG